MKNKQLLFTYLLITVSGPLQAMQPETAKLWIKNSLGSKSDLANDIGMLILDAARPLFSLAFKEINIRNEITQKKGNTQLLEELKQYQQQTLPSLSPEDTNTLPPLAHMDPTIGPRTKAYLHALCHQMKADPHTMYIYHHMVYEDESKYYTNPVLRTIYCDTHITNLEDLLSQISNDPQNLEIKKQVNICAGKFCLALSHMQHNVQTCKLAQDICAKLLISKLSSNIAHAATKSIPTKSIPNKIVQWIAWFSIKVPFSAISLAQYEAWQNLRAFDALPNDFDILFNYATHFDKLHNEKANNGILKKIYLALFSSHPFPSTCARILRTRAQEIGKLQNAIIDGNADKAEQILIHSHNKNLAASTFENKSKALKLILDSPNNVLQKETMVELLIAHGADPFGAWEYKQMND